VPAGVIEHIDQLDRPVKTHIHMVCSTLQLEHGSLPPLVQQNFDCKDKADKPRKKKDGRQGKQKEKRETLIEAFYRHDDASRYLGCSFGDGASLRPE
jgi:hypothetical protein